MNTEIFHAKKIDRIFPVLGLILLASLPLWEWLPAPGWHDRQRMGQIILITLSVGVGLWLGVFKKTPYFLERKIQYAIVLLGIVGLISSAYARQPIWALQEWSIFAGCLCLGWVIFFTYQRFGYKKSNSVLIFTVFVVVGLFSLKFISHYIIFILHGDKILDTWWLIDGFDNPRFFGQFCSLTLPLMAVPLLDRKSFGRFNFSAICIFFLWWAEAITSGTRGTWLGMAGATTVLISLSPLGRRWVLAQFMGVLVGLALFFLFLVWLPDFMGVEVMNAAGERLTTSLSARETIWQQAQEMLMQKPWLGFGPMHFADISNPIAAHPHQAILQWASEWGIPSTLLICVIVGYGFLAIFRRIRSIPPCSDKESTLYICLSASIFSSLLQSMVDGVFVMPYTELWLTLNVAWLIALHYKKSETSQSNFYTPITYAISATFLATATLLLLAVTQYHPESVPPQQGSKHYQPRFWVQGVIAFKKP